MRGGGARTGDFKMRQIREAGDAPDEGWYIGGGVEDGRVLVKQECRHVFVVIFGLLRDGVDLWRVGKVELLSSVWMYQWRK